MAQRASPHTTRTAPYSRRQGAHTKGHQHAVAGSSSQHEKPQGNPRAIARDKWNRLLGGNAYLDPGPGNRLTMSLRSPSWPDVDFALERLVRVSSVDPDLLRLSDFPGLLEGLLNLIKTFIDARKHGGSNAVIAQSLLDEMNESSSTQARCRTPKSRAYEAALVLRNIAPERTNPKQLATSKRLRPLVAAVLEEGLYEGNDDLAELQIYMLEIFEVVAESTALRLAPRSSLSSAPKGKSLDSTTTSAAPAATRLFPLLARLTRSPDRALVIASYRCLTACCFNEESRPVVSFVNADLALPPDTHHPLETAIELLAIKDTELVTAALYFVYQQTLVPANAVAFCSRPDLPQVLRLIVGKLHVGATQRTSQQPLPVPGSVAETIYNRTAIRHQRIIPPTPQRDMCPPLNGPVLDNLRAMEEPARAAEWMRTIYEFAPDAEVTQVALWQNYRSQFEPLYMSHQAKALLPAADIIKMTTSVFGGAVPMVVEGPQRKFIIKHIRLRDRTDMRTVYLCRWTGCQAPLGPDSHASLFQHLCHSHLSPTMNPIRCCWANCMYHSRHVDAAALTANELQHHVIAHLPVYQPPPRNDGDVTQLNAAQAQTEFLHDLPTTIQNEWYARDEPQIQQHGSNDDSSIDIGGLPFVASLVLRNIVRTAKNAMASVATSSNEPTTQDRKLNSTSTMTTIPNKAVSIESLTANETSILVLLEHAAEGTKPEVHDDAELAMERLDTVEFDKAKDAMAVLQGFESGLVRSSILDQALTKVLGDVLSGLA
ncbi:Chromatin structure-remodeling complex protein rsc9 [Microbotryomycetes sp. JL221]|nr:Chromatin structure-remodeling complex protein rsc9 [Microbotryomycetes sp. JL221]